MDSRGEVQLRVVENSGTGSFRTSGLRFKTIQAAFDRAPKSEPVSAHMLLPLFRGTSSNCCYFCAAVLKSEGLLQPSEKRKKRFDRVDPAAWLAEVRDRAGRQGSDRERARRAARSRRCRRRVASKSKKS